MAWRDAHPAASAVKPSATVITTTAAIMTTAAAHMAAAHVTAAAMAPASAVATAMTIDGDWRQCDQTNGPNPHSRAAGGVKMIQEFRE